MEKHPESTLEKRAGLGKRFVARILDWLLISTPFTIIYALVQAVLQGSDTAWVAAAYLFFGLSFRVVYCLYQTIMEATYGYTLGKLALGMVVAGKDGAEIGWGQSIARNLLRFLGVWVFPFSAILAVILIAVSDDKQRLGDMVGSTVVVKQA